MAHENAAGICLIESRYLCKSALQKLHVLVKKFARPMSGLELVSVELYNACRNKLKQGMKLHTCTAASSQTLH
jgi:hypothetical protein